MKYLFFNLVSLACVAAAFWLAIKDKGDWGWFLLVALFCAVAPGGKKSDD